MAYSVHGVHQIQCCTFIHKGNKSTAMVPNTANDDDYDNSREESEYMYNNTHGIYLNNVSLIS